MSLVTAGRAHIRPSSRTYLAFGWKVREFADTTVFIEMDSRTRCLPRARPMLGSTRSPSPSPTAHQRSRIENDEDATDTAGRTEPQKLPHEFVILGHLQPRSVRT